MKVLKSFLLTAIALIAFSPAPAQEPDGYYTSCENSCGSALLTKLKNKISSHTNVGYDGLWEVYNDADVDENGKIWDMYSTKRWTQGKEHCGNYKNVGDCINREHSVPQSWFNEASPMKSDAFHVYPTDGKVNGQRSNFPYGECANGTTLPSSNGVQALGKLGTCTFPGYSGKVFEPVDEYKGDFARTYFYMAACYNDRISSWGGDMFAGNSFPGFKSWVVNLLLKWHRQDPVSEKEIKRNNAVYRHQRNRNPFIDHPELAEHIWGNKSTTPWTLSSSAEPEFILPVSGSTVDFGTVSASGQSSLSITVKAAALTKNVTASVSGTGVSLSRTSIPYAEACSADGATLTVTWVPQAAGSLNAALTLSSDGASTTVVLTGNAVEGLPALAASDITPYSFSARWIYVGDADARDCYTLHVTKNGANVAGYPKDVTAAAQEYAVTGLEPNTAYKYWLVSASMTSDAIDVTTAELIPSLGASVDVETFVTEPGKASSYALVELDIENITGDLEATVDAPFELSLDRSTWNDHIVFPATTTAIYLRLGATSVGDYETTLKITGDEILNDEITVRGTVAVPSSGGLTYFVADGYEVADADKDAVIVTIYNPDKSTTATNDIKKDKDKTLAADGYTHSSDHVTLAFSEGTNTSNGPVVWYKSGVSEKDVRMYKGNNFTLTPATATKITKVEILSNNNVAFKVGQTSLSATNFLTTYTNKDNGPLTFTASDSTRPSYIAVTTESSSSDVIDIVSPDTAEPVYYDLRGIRIASPRSGEIYIKVTPSGAEKVIF